MNENEKFLRCPITSQIFHSPVILVNTSQRYEEQALKKWFDNRRRNSQQLTDPLTNNIVEDHTIPCLLTKNLVEDFLQKNPEMVAEQYVLKAELDDEPILNSASFFQPQQHQPRRIEAKLPNYVAFIGEPDVTESIFTLSVLFNNNLTSKTGADQFVRAVMSERFRRLGEDFILHDSFFQFQGRAIQLKHLNTELNAASTYQIFMDGAIVLAFYASSVEDAHAMFKKLKMNRPFRLMAVQANEDISLSNELNNPQTNLGLIAESEFQQIILRFLEVCMNRYNTEIQLNPSPSCMSCLMM